MPVEMAMDLDAQPRPNEDLLRRWPDPSLIRAFHGIFDVYRAWCAGALATSGEEAARVAYARLCGCIRSALLRRGTEGAAEGLGSPEEERVRCLMLNLHDRHQGDWLQRLASILAMLMHFALDARAESLLVNRRRRGRPFPTYPTSPAVARLVAEILLSSLLPGEIPATCRSIRTAERYAERALAFRIFDPSIESGQLLLEVAEAVLRRVHRRHPPGTREARLLGRALVEKLCHDCLWGIDRNELAPPTFGLLLTLLGAEHGVTQLTTPHVFTADALDLLSGALPTFDGVVNNPPWGEVLAAAERDRLRDRFPSLRHRSDTYVSFSELALRSLRPGGAFAMILPSQAATALNATGLRELLLRQTRLERLVLLPRAAFGDATVRGLLLAGRVQPGGACGPCHVTVYPIVKRMDSLGPPQSYEIPWGAFRRLGLRSWSPLLGGPPCAAGRGPTVPLGSLAVVAFGVQVYGIGRGTPRQTPEVLRLRPFSLVTPGPGATPAIRGRNVQPFQVLDPEEYLLFGSWLARVGDHESHRRRSRVFVRELCRRDGRLSAAVARDGFLPLHGVLTVVPDRIDPRLLVGILNSGQAAEYVRTHAASFSKVDFQRITVAELRRLPVPAAALDAATRAELGFPSPSSGELALRSELIEIVEALSQQDPGATHLRERLEGVVTALFHAGPGPAAD